jgi:hypothetical protein
MFSQQQQFTPTLLTNAASIISTLLKYVQQNSDQYNANTTLLTCIVH